MISCKEYHDLRMEQIKATVSKMENVPTLLIIQVGDNEASNRYVRNKIKDCEKVGIKAEVAKFDKNIAEKELITQLHYKTPKYDGVIIQLPLPKQIDENFIKTMIPKKLDVDGFVNPNVTPCTPRGIMDWLKFNDVNLDGMNVTIIGRSELVGKPLAELMLKENATVTICHSHTQNLDLRIEYKDIVVCATGQQNLLTKNMMIDLPTIQLVIDVGINFNESGKLCGDCEPNLPNVSYQTPVPNGVGLLTRVALLDNLIDLVNKNNTYN